VFFTEAQNFLTTNLDSSIIYAFFITFISTYVFSLVVDMGRSVLEVFFNFIRKPGCPPLVLLSPEECAIVIPCHNSDDCIENTLSTLPKDYTVICVANACKDDTVSAILRAQATNPNIELIDTEKPGKIRAVVLGAILARNKGYSHFMLLDDDIEWTQVDNKPAPITVYNKDKSITALPVVPSKVGSNWVRNQQAIEYQMMCASKRAQGNLGNVIMASGAAGVYKLESFMDAIQEHDGEHIGDDLQTSYIHHVKGMKIDFNSESVVATHPPATIKAWWKQRAHRWECSPVLNVFWAFKIIFAPLNKSRNPGWWIRGVALYRNLVIFNDILRLMSFPVVLILSPLTLVGVWVITYCSVLLKMLTFVYFFKNENYVKADMATVIAVITYPFYGVLMWASRLWALPKGLLLVVRYHIRGKRLVSKFSCSIASLEAEISTLVRRQVV